MEWLYAPLMFPDWEWALWYTGLVHLVFPVLAGWILIPAFRTLLRRQEAQEVWGQLGLPNGAVVPLRHWENILGRGNQSDVLLTYPSISRQHAALCRREGWTLYDLQSKGGTLVNGERVTTSAPVSPGDTITLGGVSLRFLESCEASGKASPETPCSSCKGLWGLTAFQALTCLQLLFALGKEAMWLLPISFLVLTAAMWGCYGAARRWGNGHFEMETIAFFLSTLSLAVTASSAQRSVWKQLLAVLLGLGAYYFLLYFLSSLERVRRFRWPMAAVTVGLLAATLVLGQSKYGAVNWITLGDFSIQPSELAKISYIFAGAATLERLFHKRNITLFILLTGVCIGLLGLMSDFGTAAVFFVTFLVIAYLRSGDWATLGLICGGAVFGAGIVVTFKPYILSRFAAWGQAWANPYSTGYQQSRAMSAAASGGLFGLGAGNGWLERIGAADTDLVFGMLCEEWGMVIAFLAVTAVLTLALCPLRSLSSCRSSYYAIASCAAGALLVFQTALNVFGAVDLLPLTGVTFPFVSNGGSAMVSAWGLLAFFKAAEERRPA